MEMRQPSLPSEIPRFAQISALFAERLPGLTGAEFMTAGRDLAEISRKCLEVVAKLESWSAPYPAIRQVRILPLALSVTAAAPFSNTAALAATARVGLWIFALDDLFDEESSSPRELRVQTRHLRQVLRGANAGAPSQPLSAALGDLNSDLASYTLFHPLKNQWQRAMLGTLDGMRREFRWRQLFRRHGPEAFPTYATYLASGRFSIGGPPHIWSALITIDDPSALDHLSYLETMEEIASTCIRLANDLRTHDKEIAEGQFNSLDILRADRVRQGMPLEKALEPAIQQVRAEIGGGLERLAQMAHQSRTASSFPECSIARIAEFVCRFYAGHDFHTFGQDRD